MAAKESLARRITRCALVAGFVLLPLAAAGTAVARKSVTVDEFQMLPHGYGILRTGSFHLAGDSPPLPDVISALPMLAVAPRLDVAPLATYLSPWQVGYQFMQENRDHYHYYFMWARIVSLTFLGLTCFMTYVLSRRLYGDRAAFLSMLAAACSPNLLAHGALVTHDIYLAATVLIALWAVDRILMKPDWKNAAFLGVALLTSLRQSGSPPLP